MWKSQIRLDDETILRVRQFAASKRRSLNQTLLELIRDQLAIQESEEFRKQTCFDRPVPDDVWLDTSDSQE